MRMIRRYRELAEKDKLRFKEENDAFKTKYPVPILVTPKKRVPKDRTNDPEYIKNPKSGKFVKRTTKAGINIIAAEGVVAAA